MDDGSLAVHIGEIPKFVAAIRGRARDYHVVILGTAAAEPVIHIREHLRVTGGALKNWAVAQLQDSLAVGILWLAGLYALHVPLAPLWALLAAVLQVVPHLGPILGLLGPLVTAALFWGDWRHPVYVLILYAGIVVVDGILLQPYIMKRTAKVPIWASILVPIVLGILWPIWGVLLAPPLLAVVYAYKTRFEKRP